MRWHARAATRPLRLGRARAACPYRPLADAMNVAAALLLPVRSVRSQYEDFMRHVFTHGVDKSDRTGTGTKSVFGHQMRFDLKEGFPLVTTKKVRLKSISQERLWVLTGSRNNN